MRSFTNTIVAASLGVSASSDDPDIDLSIADGSIISAQLTSIQTMQLGPFELKNVRCAVLGPKATDAAPLLGMSFLGSFEIKLSHDTVELTQVNPPILTTSEK